MNYKQLDCEPNWTQQNKNNSNELKNGLNSDDDHNQNEKCSELNCYKMMYPCR